MCIPIIYISCVKILRMYSVKNSLMLMVICCFHILVASAGQQHCFLTARGTEERLFERPAEFDRGQPIERVTRSALQTLSRNIAQL